jgi:hypothetical protein
MALINRRYVLATIAALTGGIRLVWAQSGPQALNPRLSGDIAPVHDPCIIRQDDT